MASVDDINQEIESQKNRLAELEHKKASLEQGQASLEQEDTKALILDFCNASVNFLKYINSIFDMNNELGNHDLRKTWPDECHIAGLLAEAIYGTVGSLSLPQVHVLGLGFRKGRESALQEWQTYKNKE